MKVPGDERLRGIAQELVATVRSNVTIDWTLRENVRAHLRVLVKRMLLKHGYPTDKQEKATQTVLEQAALFRRMGRLVKTAGLKPGKRAACCAAQSASRISVLRIWKIIHIRNEKPARLGKCPVWTRHFLIS